MSDLKPCPFCGSANVHSYSYKEAVYRQYAVKCKKCGARIMAQSTELAIEKWNRRVVTDTNVGSKEQTANVINQDYIGNYVFGTCSFCGAPVIQNDKYCSECGEKLDWRKDE